MTVIIDKGEANKRFFGNAIAIVICNASAFLLPLLSDHFFANSNNTGSSEIFKIAATFILALFLFLFLERNWLAKALLGPLAAIAGYIIAILLFWAMSIIDFRDTMRHLPDNFFSVVPITAILIIFMWRNRKLKEPTILWSAL